MRWAYLGVLLVWAQGPFWLDSRKRLPPFELTRKKAGWVWTGYPSASYDPNRGLGFALALGVAYNGAKADSFFALLSFRHLWRTQLGFYIRQTRYVRLSWDWLWPLRKPYRLMLRLNYRDDAQIQVWGPGASTLSYTLPGTTWPRYYQSLKQPIPAPNNLLYTQEAYHRVWLERLEAWLVVERLLAHGLLRVDGGVRCLYEKPSSLAGLPYRFQSQTAYQLPTLWDSLRQGEWQPLVISALPQLRPFLGLAVIYDTRDFEIDPHQGLVLEATQEIALPQSIYKAHLALRTYITPYTHPKGLPRLTLASHVLAFATWGSRIPLWDLYYVMRYAEAQRLEALSGPNLLRAYRENRFIAPYGFVSQLELRTALLEKTILNQHFIVGLVGFVDVGTGTDHPLAWKRPWRADVGSGFRALWNLQTVLRADWAYSREGWQILFTTGHAF